MILFLPFFTLELVATPHSFKLEVYKRLQSLRMIHYKVYPPGTIFEMTKLVSLVSLDPQTRTYEANETEWIFKSCMQGHTLLLA